MARPWIISGMMLVLMETLADFGAVAVFNYDTLTTAIYKAWFSMFSFSAASQLASLLIVIVFVLIIIEQRFRARMRYSETKQSGQIVRIVLVGWRAWSVTYLSFSVLFLHFCYRLHSSLFGRRMLSQGILINTILSFSGIPCCYLDSLPYLFVALRYR